MPFVQQIVDRALEHLGVKETGQPVDYDDADLCLRALRSLLDLWQLDSQLTIGLQEFVYTPAAGQQTVTIGPAGQIAAPMPVRLDPASFYRNNGVDREFAIADTLEQYNAVAVKTATGPLSFVYYQRGNTGQGTIYLSPAANGTEELHFWAWQDFVNGYQSLTLGTNLTLPNGMQNAIEWNLAAEVADDFGGAKQSVLMHAANAKRMLQRSNFKSRQLAPGIARRPGYVSFEDLS